MRLEVRWKDTWSGREADINSLEIVRTSFDLPSRGELEGPRGELLGPVPCPPHCAARKLGFDFCGGCQWVAANWSQSLG